jgi:hypothetical protein
MIINIIRIALEIFIEVLYLLIRANFFGMILNILARMHRQKDLMKSARGCMFGYKPPV